ncbi:MAG: hypothetical protein P5690_18805 [Limnospira sp. PMC 1236.20]|nr:MULTISPECIES: hypothetical protein [unclassified Limnospira]MDT9261389.1 hypothetical protein [Limnospira sp. PMC 1236.20]
MDNRFRDGVAVGDRSAVENPTDGWGADYLWIGDVTEPFTLTGCSKPPQIGSGLPNSSGELGNATCPRTHPGDRFGGRSPGYDSPAPPQQLIGDRHIKTLKRAPPPPPPRHPLRRRNIFHPDETHPRSDREGSPQENREALTQENRLLPNTDGGNRHSFKQRGPPRSTIKRLPPNKRESDIGVPEALTQENRNRVRGDWRIQEPTF